ncbi:MAG: nuclear transport factor 2 family protein [Pseudomonadota bacterium]
MQTSPTLAGDGIQATTEAATQRLIALYEEISPARLSGLDAHYAPDAQFKDPFNDVRGVPAITQIFAHMFATLDQPRFTVTQHIVQGDQAFLGWEFRFHMRRWRPKVEQCIHGATLVRFDAEGLVTLHRDYWDAAQELYEKLPVLGSLMRWLRKSASTGAGRR